MAQSALTTTFTAASSCTTDVYTNSIYYSIGGPSPSACFPSGWVSTSQYFSPGICPLSYTIACSSTELINGGKQIETQATCCPINYNCYTPSVFNFPGQACVSTISSVFISSVLSVAAPTDSGVPITATFQSSTEAINGYGVSIRFQAADFSTVFSTSTPTSSLAFTPISSSATPTSTSSSSVGGGLSSGAKAAIGVSIGVIALTALFLLGFFFIKRRNNERGYRPPGEIKGHGMLPIERDQESKEGAYEVYSMPAKLPTEGRRNDRNELEGHEIPSVGIPDAGEFQEQKSLRLR